MKRICTILAVTITLATATSAHAAFVVNFAQVGADVVATGSGTIDTTGLPQNGTWGSPPGTFPLGGEVNLGGGDWHVGLWRYMVAPSSAGFGAYGATDATSWSGDPFAFAADVGYLMVPLGYTSGAALTDQDIFANTTLAAMHLTNNSSTVWNFGSGANADSLTVNVGAVAVPEPATWALMLVGFGAIGAASRRNRNVRVAYA